MAILSVGELDFIEGQPFQYVYLSRPDEKINYYKSKTGMLRYEKEVPGTWITSATKARWMFKGPYYEDLNKFNLLNTNPFDEKKTNLYFFNGHETERIRKLKEDRERQQVEEKARIAIEKATIDAENKRIAEEKRQEESRKWQADYDAKAPERARIAEEEKRVREETAELLRQRIIQGEPATKGNVFIGDRVKRNDKEATVVGEWYEIQYPDATTEVVKLNDLINMSAVERRESKSDGRDINSRGGTRRKRKNKKNRTRYGMEKRT